MSAPVVCAPLAIEARAVRRGLGDAGQVVRTGMGTSRSERAAARLAAGLTSAGPGTPLAIMGTCGGLAADLEPGELVVATSVIAAGSGDDGPSFPAAAVLAGELRRAGLIARTGPVATVPSVILGGDRRRQLAADGLVAVDMESAVLLRAAAGRPAAVIRAVSDAPGHRFAGPAALRSLRLAGPVLARWAAACQPRQVLLASPRSFCAGVERAIGVVEHVLDRTGAPVYVRKQIVHNGRVVNELADRGAIFVEELDEVPDGARVVFSAHGVSPAVRDAASDRGLRAIDATCPLVAKVHAEARRFAAEGYLIVLIGHGDHEEVQGTYGEAPESIVVVSEPEQVTSLAPADPGKVVYLTQTTLAPDDTAGIIAALTERFPAAHGPGSEDICYATANRQDALRAVAAKSDLVLVAGSPNSSNSVRLVETARRAGSHAYLVEGPGDIELGWLAGAATIGITGGASTPPAVITEIVAALGGLGPVEVTEHVSAIESIQFNFPKEARAL